MASNSSLTTIYSWSLTMNNMVNISLMKDNESKFNKFFIFFNVIPSSRGSDGNRTYSFHDGINFKLQPYKLYEISQVIPAYLKGGQKMLGNYGIINDSSKSSYGGDGLKSLYFNYSPAEEKNKNIPGIFLVAKVGEKSINLGIPAPTALALAKMCEHIFELCMKMDIEAYEPYTGGRASDSRGSESGGGRSAKQQSHSDSNAGGSEDFNSFNDDAPF